ncbi:Uncharacterised protein [Elizabethkingia anophelis]|uniref:Uncharacterized protein n=1 Tax=Elizabethkingia anophelis TaxID=1117645 RepID=A0A7Z7PX20_9FLAO|nr:Uncharacterised protein [Elizabethkingia anophelis]
MKYYTSEKPPMYRAVFIILVFSMKVMLALAGELFLYVT